jgi:hypothetical protein
VTAVANLLNGTLEEELVNSLKVVGSQFLLMLLYFCHCIFVANYFF